MTRQEVRGKVKKVKGKAKETVGILTGNRKLEREGSLQSVAGEIQEGLGRLGRKVGDAVTNLGNAIKK
jgi:uncharacterized protein YjbJ (UPF0337 family)